MSNGWNVWSGSRGKVDGGYFYFFASPQRGRIVSHLHVPVGGLGEQGWQGEQAHVAAHADPEIGVQLGMWMGTWTRPPLPSSSANSFQL